MIKHITYIHKYIDEYIDVLGIATTQADQTGNLVIQLITLVKYLYKINMQLYFISPWSILYIHIWSIIYFIFSSQCN